MTERKKIITILLLVVGITALVHCRCLFLGFNSFWDLIHVYRNPFQAPLSLGLISQTFTELVEADYIPIRLLSNSFDYTFWKFNPFGHHLTSYLLFLINVALVFLLVEKVMARAGCQSSRRIMIAGLTAILFGIHPLKVEVVSWITPREYIICTCFYLLSVLLYIKWVGSSSIKWYLLAVLCALGAGLSQPLSVSLPLVLLILDYYPLQRFRGRQWKRILVEKLPFFAIALLITVIFIQIRRQVGIMHPAELSSLLRNLLEFPAVIGFYVWKTIYPRVLLPIYPVELTNNPRLIFFSGLVITGLIVFAVAKRKKNPALLTGMLIFIATLLPFGGVVRSGATVLADRYLQIVIIPLLLGLAWVIVRSWRSFYLRWPVVLLTLTWMVFLIWKTITYTGVWDQAIALTRQAYDRYPQDKVIEIFMLRTYVNVAMRLIEEGEIDRALGYVHRALEVRSDYIDIYLVWAYALEKTGEMESAREVRRKAAEIQHELAERYFNEGLFFARREDYRKAETLLKESLIYNKNRLEAYYNLSVIYEKQGDLQAAADELKKALAIYPTHPQLHRRLIVILESQNNLSQDVD